MSSAREFIEKFRKLATRVPGSGIFPRDGVITLVRREPDTARAAVHELLNDAWSLPAYLQLAAIIAIAIRDVVGDHAPSRQVLQQAELMGATDVLERLTFKPTPLPADDAPERQLAIAWWKAHSASDDAWCDECGTRLLYGDGYITQGRPRRIGTVTLEGDDLLCSHCFVSRR